MRFTTQTGSEYVLRPVPKGEEVVGTWERLSRTVESGKIRSEHGYLLAWPEIFVGKPAFLWDSRVLAGFDGHYVVTSPVVHIEEEIG